VTSSWSFILQPCVHCFSCSLNITFQEFHLLPFSCDLLHYSDIIVIVVIYGTGGHSQSTKLVCNLDGLVVSSEVQRILVFQSDA